MKNLNKHYTLMDRLELIAFTLTGVGICAMLLFIGFFGFHAVLALLNTL